MPDHHLLLTQVVGVEAGSSASVDMSNMSSKKCPLDHRECCEKTHKNARAHRTISSICHHPMLGCLPYLNASGGIDNCNLFPDPKSIVVEKKHARKERRGCSSLRFIMKAPALCP